MRVNVTCFAAATLLRLQRAPRQNVLDPFDTHVADLDLALLLEPTRRCMRILIVVRPAARVGELVLPRLVRALAFM